MKKILLLVAMMATMSVGVNAEPPQERTPNQHSVPAYRGMIVREQPTGYQLRTFLRGDERKHWMMTEDGWQIMEDARGWYVYATMNRKGKVKASCTRAMNLEDRKAADRKWLEKHGIKKFGAEE